MKDWFWNTDPNWNKMINGLVICWLQCCQLILVKKSSYRWKKIVYLYIKFVQNRPFSGFMAKKNCKKPSQSYKNRWLLSNVGDDFCKWKMVDIMYLQILIVLPRLKIVQMTINRLGWQHWSAFVIIEFTKLVEFKFRALFDSCLQRKQKVTRKVQSFKLFIHLSDESVRFQNGRAIAILVK